MHELKAGNKTNLDDAFCSVEFESVFVWAAYKSACSCESDCMSVICVCVCVCVCVCISESASIVWWRRWPHRTVSALIQPRLWGHQGATDVDTCVCVRVCACGNEVIVYCKHSLVFDSLSGIYASHLDCVSSYLLFLLFLNVTWNVFCFCKNLQLNLLCKFPGLCINSLYIQ